MLGPLGDIVVPGLSGPHAAPPAPPALGQDGDAVLARLEERER
ncbi:hypothetical protein [Nonomuraea sp. NPDC050786]